MPASPAAKRMASVTPFWNLGDTGEIQGRCGGDIGEIYAVLEPG